MLDTIVSEIFVRFIVDVIEAVVAAELVYLA
jgi:hypothetical protein